MFDEEEDYEFKREEEINVPYVTFELDIRDVYQVYKALGFHLDKWSGNPTDPYEQERIKYMRDFFYRMVLEYKFREQ